ncbi:Leucine-rich repeat-containing protein 15 [Holothuria leucospilota]|uniref:Leucine-rich repeat-containing protein 15 n=1 Tax=Holothuria leucospilota TaxID=206669 RepID=A0A9Q1C9N6_HOLLE|nr:Leucine-rich repeat-containing protein 15 [Holothuria leucospilota]
MLQFDSLIFLFITHNFLKKSFRIPSKVTNLELSENNLEEVGLFLKNCSSLVALDISHNDLATIPERSFEHCRKLEHLSITYNPFKVIQNESFYGLESLTLVRISHCDELTIIEPTAFEYPCKSLETLLIYECKSLRHLPVGWIKGCKHISFLHTPFNHLTTFNENNMPKTDFITMVKLNGNFFGPRGLSGRTFDGIEAINQLQLDESRIEDVPVNLFDHVQLLGILNLGRNGLTKIPEKLFASKEFFLRELYLYRNKLTHIPRQIFKNLKRLESLYLFGNEITQLPEQMLLGTSVTSIYLFGNNISTISGSPFNTGSNDTFVELVHLEGNPLAKVSSNAFDGIARHGRITMVCDVLKIPWKEYPVDIWCVGNTYSATISVAQMGAWALNRCGFTCQNEDQSSNCTACALGTYGDGVQVGCKSCPRGGFYQDEVAQMSEEIGSIACKKCNDGTFVMDGGGTSPLSCEVCPEGTNKTKAAMFRACFCLQNYFRRDRFGPCERCPHEGLNCSFEIISIRQGYYWNWSYTDLDLYKEFVANILQFDNSYDPRTTTFTETLPYVHKCPQSNKCANDNGGIEGNCKIGYTGWMCSKCTEGYFPSFGFCHRCNLPSFLIEVVIFAVLLVSFCFYLWYMYRKERLKKSSRSIVDVTIARGKIILAFYQIMGEFWDSLDSVYWPKYFKSIAQLMTLLELNFASLLIKPSCFIRQLTLSPYEEFIIGVSFPVLLVVLVVVAFITLSVWGNSPRDPHKAFLRQIRIRRWKENLMTFLISLLFVTYTSTCNVIFALYKQTCETFPLDEGKEHNVTLLRSDYAIDCSTALHRKFEIAAYVATAYTFLFPGFLLLQLWRFSKTVGSSGNETANHGDEETECINNYPIWLRFLCENYKPRFWFWEIIELCRKVTQTFVVILCGWDSPVSIWLTVAIAAVFLTLHASYSPMKDRFEHRLQLTALWAIFLNMLVAAVPAQETENHSESNSQLMMGVLLTVLNFGVLAVMAGKALITVAAFLKVNTQKQVGSLDEDETYSLQPTVHSSYHSLDHQT